jgi:glutaredoxin 3
MLHDPSLTYRPFQYPWAVEYNQTHEIDLHWHEKEVNLQQDIQQWNDGKITEQEKQFITNVLRLFTQSDVAVGEAYKHLLIPYFQNNEVSNMLTSFANRESVHQRAYALIPESLGFPESTWHEFMDFKEMKQKFEFIAPHVAKNNTATGMATALANQIFSEGVCLFGSFAMLLYFKQHGKMLGMCEVVEWSIRDETLHVQANADLFRAHCEETGCVSDALKRRIYSMARECAALEEAFIHQAYSIWQPPGLPKEDLIQYIQYLTDRRLVQMGLKENFGVALPASLEFVSWVTSAPRFANFFERRVTDYQQAGLTGTTDWQALLAGSDSA